MDFMKLYSLIRTRRLYFPSAAVLLDADPFEGSMTKLHSDYASFPTIEEGKFFAKNDPLTWPEQIRENPTLMDAWMAVHKHRSEDLRNMRKYICINSWHMNPVESMAMWKIYSERNYGIAVVSSIEKLIGSLEEASELFTWAV